MSTENNEIKALYEVAFHIVSKVTEEEATKEFSSIKDFLSKKGSKVALESGPALIDLAYTISKAQESKYDNYNTAYFAWIKFEATPELIAELKETLDLNKNILRFLITKTEIETATPVESFIKKQDQEEVLDNVQNEEVESDESEEVSDESEEDEDIVSDDIDKAIEGIEEEVKEDK